MYNSFPNSENNFQKNAVNPLYSLGNTDNNNIKDTLDDSTPTTYIPDINLHNEPKTEQLTRRDQKKKNDPKKYSISLTDSRIIAKNQALNYGYKKFNTLHKIQLKSFHTPDHKFNDLMTILSNKDFLFHCLGTISKKEGILTPGIDNITIDNASLQTINDISDRLKKDSYKFTPIKRIFISKTPGTQKNVNKEATKLFKKDMLTTEKIKAMKIRPLGICAFKDKIVQEGIRLILHCIYEPEFSKINNNFGFRPNYGVHDAIYNITTKAKTMSYAIEADVSGAFDNVDHTIMENILRKKIADKRFLRLIINGLKCGINYSGKFSESLLGTTQGSSASPILYNIYFHEFDNFINTKIKQFFIQKNLDENRIDKPINKKYNAASKKKSLLKFRQIALELKRIFQTYGKDSLQFKKHYELFKKIKTQKSKYDKIQQSIPSINKSRQTLRFHYTRYADDWIFFTNTTLDTAEELKHIFTTWIFTNLNLELHPTKTKITDLNKRSSKVKFLGFQLSYALVKRTQQIGIKQKKRLNLINKTKFTTSFISRQIGNDKSIFKQRTTNPTLIAAWDRERVLNKLKNLGFISNSYGIWRGRRKSSWTVLEAPEIIEKYNYMIRGYVDFYSPITYYPTDIHFLTYLLQYSCLHTLANKFNTSLKGIIKKYSKYPLIKYEITKQISNKTSDTITQKTINKQVQLFTWDNIKSIILSRIKSYRKNIKDKISLGMSTNPDNIPNIKINWRTKYKLETDRCPICGCPGKIQYHHVKHIRIGKITGFLQILKNLNRKQIPCCKNCHDKIHNGTYDNLKLSELYDERLIIL